jgi:hypothetical protein
MKKNCLHGQSDCWMGEEALHCFVTNDFVQIDDLTSFEDLP